MNLLKIVTAITLISSAYASSDLIYSGSAVIFSCHQPIQRVNDITNKPVLPTYDQNCVERIKFLDGSNRELTLSMENDDYEQSALQAYRELPLSKNANYIEFVELTIDKDQGNLKEFTIRDIELTDYVFEKEGPFDVGSVTSEAQDRNGYSRSYMVSTKSQKYGAIIKDIDPTYDLPSMKPQYLSKKYTYLFGDFTYTDGNMPNPMYKFLQFHINKFANR